MGFIADVLDPAGVFHETEEDNWFDRINDPLDLIPDKYQEYIFDPYSAYKRSMMPDQSTSPTYASDQIRNLTAEGVPVSRCYGKCKIGGNKIRFSPDKSLTLSEFKSEFPTFAFGSGGLTDIRIMGSMYHEEYEYETEKDYFDMLVAHCQGEVQGVVTYYINDIEWSELEGENHSKTEYCGTRSQLTDSRFSVDILGSPYRDMAYTAFTLNDTDKQVGRNPQVAVVMEGIKCLSLTNDIATMSFSRNNAVILADWYSNVERYSTSAVFDGVTIVSGLNTYSSNLIVFNGYIYSGDNEIYRS